MGTVLYGGKEIPLFESIVTYKDVVYGLAKSDSGRSYLNPKTRYDTSKGLPFF